MADNLTKKKPQDARKINVTQSYEISYWKNTLRCTEKELIDAVKQVGTSVDAVKRYLQNQ